MGLNRKYKVLLARSKVHQVMIHKTRKLCKSANDLEIVIIHDLATSELKKRGIIDNE